jgi:hypothetical protein
MRQIPAAGAVVVLLLATGPLSAQVGRDIRFVTAETAELRAGPSDKPEFYVTNHLRRGQPVEVVGEEPGGWLAVRPPEGSFSYINTRFLRHLYADTPNHVVTLDGVAVEVFVGSEVVNRRPTIVGCRLEKGTQVVSRGQPQTDEDGTWMPIEPPARERRYVKSSQVAKQMPEPGGAVAAASPGVGAAHSAFTPAANNPAPSSAPSANPPLTPAQLYQQAQQAERAGQVAEAIRLYALAGAGAAQSQPALSALALERARYLHTGHQEYGSGGGIPPAPPATATAGTARAPASTTVVQVSPSGAGRGIDARPASALSSAFTPQPAPQRGSSPSSWMRYRGVLRRAGRVVEGQTTYALDDPDTLRPVLYATASGNLRLDAHLNQVVELWGYTVYRGDLKNNLMTVVRIAPSP